MEVSRSLGRRRGSIKRVWAVYNRCVGDIGDGCHSEKGTCLLRKYQHNKISMILCISLIITGTENTIAPIARFSCCLFTWQTKHPQTRVCTNKNFFGDNHPSNGWFSPDLAAPRFFRRRFDLLDVFSSALPESPLPYLSPSLRIEALGPSPVALSLD